MADAFNRLAAVYGLGTLGFDADGLPDAGEPGEWRAGFSYDALGRRVAKETPWSTSETERRTAWYHYDGVRRIQDVHKDPVAGGPGGIGGQPPTGGGGGQYTIYTDREYVWGPEYVDEFLSVETEGERPQSVTRFGSGAALLLMSDDPLDAPFPFPSGGSCPALRNAVWVRGRLREAGLL